ncbi:sphingolipid transporter [Aureococcus anophagefferens]|uniref:Sphingolipid transporter n=1 Tax=Aureococcus anophagefferens TaxID=44056 RepID=A0ABR1FW19_AURAN|mmetsp:Transcript_26694/g.90999  ORF Transcript_26694/g.90999 Transcript_26694/m.90999 type:complete len:203 (+) Transcript_26694:102-710(+)
MARLALVVAACALALGGSLQLNKPTTVAPRAAAKTALGAGFGTDVRKAKKGGKKSRSSAAGLTTDNGWVPLVELECSLEAGEARAVGRSITGKPYLVRRKQDGDVVATSCECGRCEYPLTKSETQVVDGVEQVLCEMCGAAYSLDDGAGVASEAKGNPLFGALLRNKPDKPLSVYPTKELDGGAVYVNITPKSRKAAAIDAM